MVYHIWGISLRRYVYISVLSSELSSFSGNSGTVYTPVMTGPSNTSGIFAGVKSCPLPNSRVGVPVLSKVSSVRFLW
jgi:hypothetical protein